MSTTPSTARPKIDLKPVEVGVGAGAAVLTAVATSFLGTTGTLTGAAVASVIGTVSTSVLRSSAQVTNESLQRKAARLRSRPGEPDAAASEPTGTTEPVPADAAPVARGRWRRPAWWALAAGVVAAFAVALTAITGIEALAGKPLAAVVGNESGSGTTVGGGDVDRDPAPAPAPSTSPTPTTEPSTTVSGPATPTGTPDTSPTAGPTTTPSPTAGPTTTPEPTGTEPAPTTAAPSPLTNPTTTP